VCQRIHPILRGANPYAANIQILARIEPTGMSTTTNTISGLQQNKGPTGLPKYQRGCKPGKPGTDDNRVMHNYEHKISITPGPTKICFAA